MALKQIRARQDDYWNKIAIYNYRIHLMEQKEKADKKRNDAKEMRANLALQQSQQQDNKDEDARKDKAIMNEATRMNNAEKERHRQKLEKMRKQLQDMNTERDHFIAEKHQQWQKYQ